MRTDIPFKDAEDYAYNFSSIVESLGGFEKVYALKASSLNMLIKQSPEKIFNYIHPFYKWLKKKLLFQNALEKFFYCQPFKLLIDSQNEPIETNLNNLLEHLVIGTISIALLNLKQAETSDNYALYDSNTIKSIQRTAKVLKHKIDQYSTLKIFIENELFTESSGLNSFYETLGSISKSDFFDDLKVFKQDRKKIFLRVFINSFHCIWLKLGIYLKKTLDSCPDEQPYIYLRFPRSAMLKLCELFFPDDISLDYISSCYKHFESKMLTPR